MSSPSRILLFDQPIEVAIFQTVDEISSLAMKIYRLPFRINSFSVVIIGYIWAALVHGTHFIIDINAMLSYTGNRPTDNDRL